MENFWIQFADIAKRHRQYPIVAYSHPGAASWEIRNSALETIVLPFPGRGLKELFRSMAFVRKRRVRVVYFTDRKFTSWKYPLLRLAGVRTMITHDHTPGDRPAVGGVKGLVKSLWRRIGTMSCNIHISVSPYIRRRAIANARIPAGKTVVVQNGVQPIDCSERHRYMHRALGLPDDAIVCVTVGRADPYKRIDFVVEVARRCVVERCLNKLYFVHCGDGPDMDHLRRLADGAGLKEHFVFAGLRSDVPQLLCSATYALHASAGEAFSLAILEYMSAGLAVLVPDVPSVRQAIRDGQTGLWYRNGDAGHAAALLAGLCADDLRTKRLGAAAAREVRERYSLARANAQFREVVEFVLGSRSG